MCLNKIIIQYLHNFNTGTPKNDIIVFTLFYIFILTMAIISNTIILINMHKS